MHSCIYEGIVTHHRREPVVHQFQYRLFMVYLDLTELSMLVGPGSLISNSRNSCRSFLRSDHLYNNAQSLEKEVRETISQHTGTFPEGPIRLLTQLRHFGTYFSPLNLFYVFDKQGRSVQYVVAEVSNTPWQERHCYVLWEGNRVSNSSELHYLHPKKFHVSPFMEMNLEYRWILTNPDTRLSVQLENLSDSRQLFSARMELQRKVLNRQQLRRTTFIYPFMSLQIIAAIYYQALKLWWKKCPVYPHPKKQSNQVTPALDSGKSMRIQNTKMDLQLQNGKDSLTPAASADEQYYENLPISTQPN